MNHLTDLRPSRLFFCWPSRLGAFSLIALAAIMTLDKVVPAIV